MPISPWITTAQIIIPIEGLCGLILNAILFIALYRSATLKAAKLYRISSMVTAVSGFYTSFYILIFVDIFIFVDNSFASAAYGPLLFCFSQRVTEILGVAFWTQIHTMWEMIPAPSIVQWMSLARPNSTTTRRLLYAYSLPLLCYAKAWYFMGGLVPDDTLRAELVNSTRALHGTDLRDYHMFGTRMTSTAFSSPPTVGIDFRDIILFDALPSYCACYGAFAFCSIQIRSRLRQLGSASASKKTVLMQRRLFRVQIAQVFLPLVIMAPPISIALVCIILGANIANATLIMVYSVWLAPSGTAMLLLAFVAKSSHFRPWRTMSSRVMKIADVKTSKSSKS